MLATTILIVCLIGSIRCFVTQSQTSVESNLVLGNNPFWDDDTNSLYYVDMFGKAYYRYSLDEDKVYKLVVDSSAYAGFIMPIEGRKNRFLIGFNGTAVMIKWDGISSTATRVKNVFSIAADTILGGIMVTANNEFFAGGFTSALCTQLPTLSLYEYTQNKDLVTVFTYFKSTIGLALNEKKNVLYHLDTCTKQISAFDYDPSDGHLSKDRIIYKFDVARNVIPSGIALDNWGNIYTALNGDGVVVKINPLLGKIVDEIKMPTPIITSATFGGPRRDILFVTSGSLEIDYFNTTTTGNALKRPAGDLFMIRGLFSRGQPTRKPRL